MTEPRTYPTEDDGVVTGHVPSRWLDADGDGRADVRPATEQELVSIPPLPRTILYYMLALANAVAVPLAAAGWIEPLWTLIILNVAGVFGFVLAANRVPKVGAP